MHSWDGGLFTWCWGWGWPMTVAAWVECLAFFRLRPLLAVVGAVQVGSCLARVRDLLAFLLCARLCHRRIILLCNSGTSDACQNLLSQSLSLLEEPFATIVGRISHDPGTLAVVRVAMLAVLVRKLVS